MASFECDGGVAISKDFAKVLLALAKAGMSEKQYKEYEVSVKKTIDYSLKGYF